MFRLAETQQVLKQTCMSSTELCRHFDPGHPAPVPDRHHA